MEVDDTTELPESESTGQSTAPEPSTDPGPVDGGTETMQGITELPQPEPAASEPLTTKSIDAGSSITEGGDSVMQGDSIDMPESPDISGLVESVVARGVVEAAVPAAETVMDAESVLTMQGNPEGLEENIPSGQESGLQNENGDRPDISTLMEEPNPENSEVKKADERIDDSQLDSSENRIVGTPRLDSEGYHPQQEGQPTCAQACCEGIIHKHHPEMKDSVSEESLKQEAIRDSAFKPLPPRAGTDGYYVKQMLENHDIPAREWRNANLDDVESELQKGRDIIAGVDAGILWGDTRYLDEGHAIRVTGLEKDGAGAHTSVIVRDSGNERIDGQGKIPVGTFLGAWGAMGNHMFSTINSVAGTKARQ